MTKQALLDKATARQIKGRHRMNKAELLRALRSRKGAGKSAPRVRGGAAGDETQPLAFPGDVIHYLFEFVNQRYNTDVIDTTGTDESTMYSSLLRMPIDMLTVIVGAMKMVSFPRNSDPRKVPGKDAKTTVEHNKDFFGDASLIPSIAALAGVVYEFTTLVEEFMILNNSERLLGYYPEGYSLKDMREKVLTPLKNVRHESLLQTIAHYLQMQKAGSKSKGRQNRRLRGGDDDDDTKFVDNLVALFTPTNNNNQRYTGTELLTNKCSSRIAVAVFLVFASKLPTRPPIPDNDVHLHWNPVNLVGSTKWNPAQTDFYRKVLEDNFKTIPAVGEQVWRELITLYKTTVAVEDKLKEVLVAHVESTVKGWCEQRAKDKNKPLLGRPDVIEDEIEDLEFKCGGTDDVMDTVLSVNVKLKKTETIVIKDARKTTVEIFNDMLHRVPQR